MDFGSNIEIYRQKLIDITNNSNLTIGTAYYVFKDVFRELEAIYLKSIREENSSEGEIEEKEVILLDEEAVKEEERL